MRLKTKHRNTLLKIITVIFILAATVNPQIAWGSNTSTEELNKRLFTAVFNNNFALVRSSISSGANLEATNDEGLTAASLAVEKGYFKIAHYILAVIKQQSSAIKNNSIATKTLHNITKPSSNVSLNSKETQTSGYKTQTNLSSRVYNKWPENKPNPFSPDNYDNKTMPIIGIIQKPTVKTEIKGQPTKLKVKAQNKKSVPLKTPNFPAIRENQMPTPILPLAKEAAKDVSVKTPNKKVTQIKTPNIPTIREDQLPSPIIPLAKEVAKGANVKKVVRLKSRIPKIDAESEYEKIEFDEEDLFDKVWNKLNKIF